MNKPKEELVMNSVMYFMLPMLQLNKSSFGVGNFINSYVDKSGYIAVDVMGDFAVDKNTYKHPQYITDYNVEDGIRYVYAIPDEYLSDIKLFEQGRYSDLSGPLKAAISKYSNLGSNDIIIKCLNPQLADRQKIADDLGVRVDLVRELLSAPDESNFIRIK